MLRSTLLTVVFTFLLSSSCLAQFYPTQYRPPNQQWQYLQTPHFKILYSEGNDSTALQTGRILEEHYGPVQDLVGGSLNNFPVILNDYNDRSNGFVTSLHFRSEIELPPLKGKSQNPQTGNWLETVAPHELVHAMQLSNLGDYNIPQLVSIFSPDLARSFHAAMPFGVLEGLAVYHESENVAPNGGRGNYPLFTNQFNAVFNSDDRWSMGQMVQISSNTRPFTRHYIGGYEFTAWLQENYGSETTKEALDFYMDFPFLGYGVALRHATSSWPGELYDEFEKSHEASLPSKHLSAKGTNLQVPYKGREVHRPKWLSDSTLVFYGSFYNARAGFYRYDLSSDNIKHLFTTNSVYDFKYDLSTDRSNMIYSYYEANAIYDNTFKAELVRYDFNSGHSTQLTDQGRVYAPVYSGDSLLALQTKPASSQLVSLDQHSPESIRNILSLDKHQIIAVDENPTNNQLAIVANKRGLQALWIANSNNLKDDLTGPPEVAFSEGSIFDPEWHPSGEKIMFSSGFSGTHQLYEYDLQSESITQITQSAFNAFEGSYSPNGDRIAFVKQQKNERLPAILSRSDFANEEISIDRWESTNTKIAFMDRPVSDSSMVARSKKWESGEFRSGRNWLKPRTILPVFEEVSNSNEYQFGLSFHSSNVLSNQSYSADISYHQNRHWYDLTYQNKVFYPGFKLRLYSQPSYVSISEQTQNGTVSHTLLRQNKSLAVSTPIRYRFNQNIYSTSLYLEPEIRRSQLRFFKSDASSNTDFSNIFVTSLYSQFNYKLQQNIRDLQPNTGLILYSEVEQYLSSTTVEFNTIDINREIQFEQSTALRGGIVGYLSPFRRWNQSLRLDLQGLTQTNVLFDNQSLVSNAFSERILQNSQHLVSLNTRYTIPLWHVDDGGFLLPFYLNNIYLVAFSDTVTDPTFSNWYEDSRSVFGLGIRTRFRLSNLSFDIGVGLGYEPSRGNTNFFIGDF